jgi:hypothetical protein
MIVPQYLCFILFSFILLYYSTFESITVSLPKKHQKKKKKRPHEILNKPIHCKKSFGHLLAQFFFGIVFGLLSPNNLLAFNYSYPNYTLFELPLIGSQSDHFRNAFATVNQTRLGKYAISCQIY